MGMQAIMPQHHTRQVQGECKPGVPSPAVFSEPVLGRTNIELFWSNQWEPCPTPVMHWEKHLPQWAVQRKDCVHVLNFNELSPFSVSLLPLHLHIGNLNYKTKHNPTAFAHYCLPNTANILSLASLCGWQVSKVAPCSCKMEPSTCILSVFEQFLREQLLPWGLHNTGFISDLDLSVLTLLLGFVISSFCRLFLRQCLSYLSTLPALSSSSPLPHSCIVNTSSYVIFTHIIFPCW